MTNKGFTTLLLIDNDDDTRSGRSARPSGVLTSTARTFVHDGTTTEYGTQVIGTTLDHGKYYAQLLQTSSKIYYGSHEKTNTIKTKSDDRVYYKSRYLGFPHNVDNYIQSSIFQNFQPTEPYFIYASKESNPENLIKTENFEISFENGGANYRDSKSKKEGGGFGVGGGGVLTKYVFFRHCLNMHAAKLFFFPFFLFFPFFFILFQKRNL